MFLQLNLLPLLNDKQRHEDGLNFPVVSLNTGSAL